MAEKTFTISCTMEERWINHFLSLLSYMEFCGKIGHSSLIGFYSDGDGDFRPEFKTDMNGKNNIVILQKKPQNYILMLVKNN